jgi:CO dehydrogenase nickel-insertion accessory protein CooC1
MDPESATAYGDHRFDHLLTDLSEEAVQARRAVAAAYLDSLSRVKADKLSADNRIDLAILRNHLEYKVFAIDEIGAHRWNPLAHNLGGAVYTWTEEDGFDLMVMGQPDGPGCYCAANQYLAMTMDKLSENYEYIIVDNEAGMEHLSRMNLRSIDYLLIVSDPSARGILTAKRIADITGPLQLEVKNRFLIVNRAPSPVTEPLQEKINEAVAEADLPLGGIISSSDDLIDRELSGGSYLELDEDTQVIAEAFAMFDRIFQQ